MDQVLSTLRRYIIERHLPGELPENLTPDTRLQSSGILDSFAVLDVASFIEAEWGVELSASDTTPESFDHLSEIAALVIRRSSGLRRAS